MLDAPADESNTRFQVNIPVQYPMDRQAVCMPLALGVKKNVATGAEKASRRAAPIEQHDGKVDEPRSSRRMSLSMTRPIDRPGTDLLIMLQDPNDDIRNPFGKDNKSGKAETDLQHYERLRSGFDNIEGMDQAMAPTGNGSIMFDKTSGALWYRPCKEDKWERAVFHYWIRDDLSKIEDSSGEDDHGTLSGNITSCAFKRRQINRSQSAFPVCNLLYGGILVIDYSLSPVRAFPEFPMVLSSQFPGSEMMAAQLQNSAIQVEDFRARMPPVVPECVDGRLVLRPLYSIHLLSERIREARAVTGSSATTHQVPGHEKIQGFNISSQIAHTEASGGTQKQDNLAKEHAEMPIMQQGRSPKAVAPPKFAPMDQRDSRNSPPTTAGEAMALWEALQPAADHFFQLTGREPSRNEERSAPNYCMQWMDMQNQLRQTWEQTPPAPYLVSLGKWTGGITNWKSGQLSRDA